MQNKTDWIRILRYFSIPFSVFVFNYILFFLGTYDVLEWIDIPMHFFGGVSVAIALFLTLNYFEEMGFLYLNKISKIVFLVSMVALIAVLWELYEFSLEYLTGFNFQGNLNDTMSDLLLGLLGGLLSGISMVFPEKERS